MVMGWGKFYGDEVGMGLIFYRVILFTQKMHVFENDVIFSSSHVLVSDNCKQSITV